MLLFPFSLFHLLGLGGRGLSLLLGLLGGELLGLPRSLGEDSKTLHGSLADIRTELILDGDVVDGLGVVLEAKGPAELHGGASAGGLLGLEVAESEGKSVVLLRDGEALSGEATVSEGREVGHVAGLRGESDAVAGATESVVLANKLPDEISGHFLLCFF